MGEAVRREKRYIDNIPAIIWGEKTTRAYIYVHGKMANKEIAENFAKIADRKGYQTISFDLPLHGERAGEKTPCDIWNGCNNLRTIADYASGCWNDLSLYACSMGAHFSLYAYEDMNFNYCLFQSPIVNVEYLIQVLFQWFHITEDMLREKRVIETSFHTLTWDYYTYVKEHPISNWNHPTSILYTINDPLQSREVMEEFARKYGCNLSVTMECEHGFPGERGIEVEKEWLDREIKG